MTSIRTFLSVLFLLTASLTPIATAFNYTHYVDSIRPYEYVARFAFLTESGAATKQIAEFTKIEYNGFINPNANVDGGHVEYNILFPRYFRPKMLFFTSYDNWLVDSKRSLSCNELVSYADAVIHLADTVLYDTYDADAKVVFSNKAKVSPASAVWNAQGVVFFPQVKVDDYEWYRWGVVYVANCDSNSTTPGSWCSGTNNCQGPTVLDMELLFKNGKGPLKELSGTSCVMCRASCVVRRVSCVVRRV